MPVPKGYTLDNQGPTGVPGGYTLDPPTTPGAIDPNTVAGANATGMGLPGAPAAPNPIQNAIDTGKYADRDLSQSTVGGMTQPGTATMPAFAKQFGQAAVANLHSDVDNARAGAANFADNVAHHPVTALGQVVTSPLSLAINTGQQIGHGVSDIVNGDPITGISRLAGGNPDLANQTLATDPDNAGKVAWNMFGQPAAMTMAGEGASNALTDAANVMRPLDSPRTNDAFANWIAGGVKDGAPQETAAVARPVFQQAAQKLGWKNQDFLDRWRGNTPSRNLPGQSGDFRNTFKGMKEGLKLADTAVDISDAPMDEVMKQAASDPINPTVKANISGGLRQSAADADQVGNTGIAANYRSLADQVDSKKTYGELNALKRNANNQQTRMGAPGSISEQIAQQTTPIAAWQDMGDLIRQNMYPDLQARYIPPPGQPGYFDLGAMGAREKAVIAARDGVNKGFDEASALDAKVGSQTLPEKATTGSMYRTKFWLRMLGAEPTPAGKFNVLMRRGLGDIGEGGGVPETVSTVPVQQQQLQLPPPPGWTPPGSPTTFQVPTAPSTPNVISPATPMTQGYVGPMTVPNPDHTPITGPSHFQQQQELGSTAGTIPDGVRGAQSPARVRADQIGLGHDLQPLSGVPAPPGRTIEGAPTLTKANFEQHFGTAKPEVSDNGTAGMLQTNDPVLAQKALDRQTAFMQSQPFLQLPPQTQMLARQQAQQLQQQLAAHAQGVATQTAVNGMQRPVMFQVHWTPADLGVKTGRTPGVVSRVAGHGGRTIAQQAFKNPPGQGKASSSGKSKEQIEAEEEQLVNQQQ